MGLKLIYNSVGDAATSIETTGTAVDSSYNKNSIVAGSRASMVRFVVATTATTIGYEVSSGSFTYDSVVITRADLLARSESPLDFKIQEDTGGGYGDVAATAVTPLTTAELSGYDAFKIGNGQDYIHHFASDRTGVEGVRIHLDKNDGGDDDVALQFSKLIIGTAFDFDTWPEQSPAPTWSKLPTGAGDEISSIDGTQRYKSDDEITLTFNSLSLAKIQEFEAITNIKNWPVYLYDPSAYVFGATLEHCLVQEWSTSFASIGCYDLQVRFRRLRHYR